MDTLYMCHSGFEPVPPWEAFCSRCWFINTLSTLYCPWKQQALPITESFPGDLACGYPFMSNHCRTSGWKTEAIPWKINMPLPVQPESSWKTPGGPPFPQPPRLLLSLCTFSALLIPFSSTNTDIGRERVYFLKVRRTICSNTLS